jgi:hypothetical protein
MLKALCNTSVDLMLNDVWVLDIESTDADGNLFNSDPVVTVTSPSGVVTTPTVEALSLGRYRAVVTVNQAERWIAVAAASGYGTTSFSAYVQAVTLNAGLPDVDAVRAYGSISEDSWTDAEIQEVLDSEAAHQRRHCSIRGIYPPELAEALKFSVVQSLQTRSSFSSTNADEYENPGNTRPAYRHPYVKRLEAPYRKMFFR